MTLAERGGTTPPLPRARPDVLTAAIGDDLVLYDPEARTSHVLNHTAATVWAACDGRPTADISALVAERYGNSTAEVADGVRTLLEQLAESALLVGTEPPPPAPPDSDLPRRSRLDRRHAALVARGDWIWSSPPLAALDFRFSVHTDHPLVAHFLRRTLGPLGVAGTTDHRYLIRTRPSGRILLGLDGHVLRSVPDPTTTATYLLWHVNRMSVAGSRARVVLHAAAAATDDGRAVLLPASANSGKSTLAAGLVDRGFAYMSDESIGLTPDDDLLRPYPRSLSLDPGSWPLFPRLAPPADGELDGFHRASWQVPPDLIRPGCVTGARPAAVVVFPRYEAEAPTSLTPLSPTEALVELLANAFDFPELGQRGFDRLARLATATPAHRLVSSNLAEAVEAVESVVNA